MFGKRPSEITADDIERVVAEQVQEGSQVELKVTLPARKGDDPWTTGEGRIGDYARNALVAEVIAFANAFEIVREVHCDGLLEYRTLLKGEADRVRLYPGWLMGLIGNALCAAERFRRAAGAPNIEYGLEFEIANEGWGLQIGKYGGSHYGDWLGPFPEGRTIFPRYSVGPPEEFQLLSQTFERDFWHGAGHDWPDRITVDFARAFRELGIVEEGNAG